MDVISSSTRLVEIRQRESGGCAVSGAAPPEPLPLARARRLGFRRFRATATGWRTRGGFRRQHLAPPPARIGIAGGPSARFISSTRFECAPRYSLDGKQIVFESNRSGTDNIWASNDNGSTLWAVPLRIGKQHVGSPSWSPDAQRLAFDTDVDLTPLRMLAGVNRCVSRPQPQPSSTGCPTGPAMENWLYYTVENHGWPNIWRMPAVGGDAVQLTRNGGMDRASYPMEFSSTTQRPFGVAARCRAVRECLPRAAKKRRCCRRCIGAASL